MAFKSISLEKHALKKETRKNTVRKYRAKRRLKDPLWDIFYNIKYRCKKQNIKFDLIKEDIHIPKNCPLLGIPLISCSGYRADNSPSIDRINPKEGYTMNNIWVVSWRANSIKRDATIKELEQITLNLKNKLEEGMTHE